MSGAGKDWGCKWSREFTPGEEKMTEVDPGGVPRVRAVALQVDSDCGQESSVLKQLQARLHFRVRRSSGHGDLVSRLLVQEKA